MFLFVGKQKHWLLETFVISVPSYSMPSSTTVHHQQHGQHREPYGTKQKYANRSLEGQEFHRMIRATQLAVEIWRQFSVQSCGCEAKLQPALAHDKHRDAWHNLRQRQKRDSARTCWIFAAVSTPGRSRMHWRCPHAASWPAGYFRQRGFPAAR